LEINNLLVEKEEVKKKPDPKRAIDPKNRI